MTPGGTGKPVMERNLYLDLSDIYCYWGYYGCFRERFIAENELPPTLISVNRA
jgi:hypothetical protein